MMGSDELEEAHDINVTPFIDVMLVLLIIFMVAAPLATVDVKVDLPASAATAEPRPDKPIFLTLLADLTLRLGETPCRGCSGGGVGSGNRRRPGAARVPARRQGGELWRPDGGDGWPARRRLPEGGAGRAGASARAMKVAAWQRRDIPSDGWSACSSSCWRMVAPECSAVAHRHRRRTRSWPAADARSRPVATPPPKPVAEPEPVALEPAAEPELPPPPPFPLEIPPPEPPPELVLEPPPVPVKPAVPCRRNRRRRKPPRPREVCAADAGPAAASAPSPGSGAIPSPPSPAAARTGRAGCSRI